MRKLEQKFNPQDNVTLLDAEKAIDDAKMKTGESPSDFYDRLCTIQWRYPNQLTDNSIRNAMMRKSSSQYRDVIIQSLKKPDISADELMEDMQHVYRTLQSLNFEDDVQDETEVVLVQPANRYRSGPPRTSHDHQATMRCFICNQVGHKTPSNAYTAVEQVIHTTDAGPYQRMQQIDLTGTLLQTWLTPMQHRLRLLLLKKRKRSPMLA